MKAPKKNCAGLQNRRRKQTKVRPTIGRFTKKTTQLRTRKRKRSERTERNFWCSICHFALGHVDLFARAVVTVATLPFINLPNLNTTRRINRAHAYAPLLTSQSKKEKPVSRKTMRNEISRETYFALI